MIKLEAIQTALKKFDFRSLFIEELGWQHSKQNLRLSGAYADQAIVPLAELGGVVVYEVALTDRYKESSARQQLHKQIAELKHENILIFKNDQQTVWRWQKREGKKTFAREHVYLQGQPGGLFISKLAAIFVDITELDENGNISIQAVHKKLEQALDIDVVTKKFYRQYDQCRLDFIAHIHGIESDTDKRWYASILLNRLMFVYFLQKKGFLDNESVHYLSDKLALHEHYYQDFLCPLFFEGFAKESQHRSPLDRQKLGDIPYLNGGLFVRHELETRHQISVDNAAFSQLLALFNQYSWNLNDTVGGKDDEINPDVLGYIFEKYINQKAFGAYYTKPEITEYLCERTLHRLILQKVNSENPFDIPLMNGRKFDNIADLLLHLDAPLCEELLEYLPTLKLIDPACGSGAFLVAALKSLINLYAGIIGRIEFLGDKGLKNQLAKWRTEHKSLSYYIKRKIITDNLFGVDIMTEATEIAKLRLFLALVASATRLDELEPLPNIDFNILAGNSLVGLLKVDGKDFDKSGDLAQQGEESYQHILNLLNNDLENYRKTVYWDTPQALIDIKKQISDRKAHVQKRLNALLLKNMGDLGVKYEESTWDTVKNAEGKSKKRLLKIEDIEALQPFHWGFEFADVFAKGGFDAVIANPPWETFKPIDKEFAQTIDSSIERRSTNIKDFEKKLSELLSDTKNQKEYLAYLSKFSYQSEWFRLAPQFKHQSTVVNGKKTGTDINLYKLFIEQSINILKNNGDCGIVIPSGIYTDLGAKGLRDLLFDKNNITGLFCFENRKELFEGVHRSFKFVVLSFEKGGKTKEFPAAFMRHEVKDLLAFPNAHDLRISVALIRRLSPDSASVMEFKSALDIQIAEKMLKFPLLGEQLEHTWNLSFGRELDMTNDSHLFKTNFAEGRLPLYEGKMIWHFEHGREDFRYWVEEAVVKQDETNRRFRKINALRKEQKLPPLKEVPAFSFSHQRYRLGFRSITGATNERAFVVSVLPKGVVCGHSLTISLPYEDRLEKNQWQEIVHYDDKQLVFAVAVMSAFVFDWVIRQKILTNMSVFTLNQSPVPRLTEKDPQFLPIVRRAGQLICTTPQYDDLAKSIGLSQHQPLRPDQRSVLRAELDGLIAHLYGLSKAEFTHVLSTFPLVPKPQTLAARNAYEDVEAGMIK